MSQISGGPSAAGKPKQIGLVPNIACVPPTGATHGVAFEAITATIPDPMMRSA